MNVLITLVVVSILLSFIAAQRIYSPPSIMFCLSFLLLYKDITFLFVAADDFPYFFAILYEV